MKFKKIIAGVAIACGFLGLAACNDSGKVNPPAGEPSTSQQGGVTPTPSTQRDELTLSFITDGKTRIDVNMPGCTFKINGTAITSGQSYDIGNFTITFEGTITQEVFHVYLASTRTDGELIKVYNSIETESMGEFFSSILSDQHKSTDKRIYLCITTTKQGWAKGLDDRMDAQFTAMSSTDSV